VLGSSKKRYAEIGEMVVLSVQKAELAKQSRRKTSSRPSSYDRQSRSAAWMARTSLDENAVVIIEKGKKEPIAGRIFADTSRACRKRLPDHRIKSIRDRINTTMHIKRTTS